FPMLRLSIACLAASFVLAADEPTFKSDVAMTRVDAQVTDRTGRAITGLEASDFVLRVNGKPVPIRNFASENMPIDILLLLDVSGVCNRMWRGLRQRPSRRSKCWRRGIAWRSWFLIQRRAFGCPFETVMTKWSGS